MDKNFSKGICFFVLLTKICHFLYIRFLALGFFFQILVGGGGNLFKNTIIYLTLPYLTLPYLTLPYLIYFQLVFSANILIIYYIIYNIYSICRLGFSIGFSVFSQHGAYEHTN